MNTITIELCAEDRARLDIIINGLLNLTEGKQEPVQITPTPEPTPEPAPVEEPQEQPEAPKVDRADIQRKVVELSGNGKKDAVRDIVKAYADRVSGIPEDKLHEVWQKLNALED